VRFVDRREGGRLVERQPEDRLAGRPYDPRHAVNGGRREHVVRRDGVVAERLPLRPDARRRDRCEVHDGVSACDHVVCLPEIREVRREALAGGTLIAHEVDAQDVVPVVA
jgi:hypothetical protein